MAASTPNVTYSPGSYNQTSNGTHNGTHPQPTGEVYVLSSVTAIMIGILVPQAICTVIVLARIYSRLFLLRKWFIDDSLIVAAWLVASAICALYAMATELPCVQDLIVQSSNATAYAKHTSDGLDSNSVQEYQLLTYMGLIIYQVCLCLTKLSILAFYIRMFNSRPIERRLAWGSMIVVLLYGIPLLFMSAFQCHPSPQGQSQPFGQTSTCFGFTSLLISSASLHSAADAWLILLIIPCIIRLELPRRQKVALSMVLSLSIFVIAASMTRLQLALRSGWRPAGGGIQASNTLLFFIMTILECDLAIICASAPTLRPVLARLCPCFGIRDRDTSGGVARNNYCTRPSGDASLNLTAVSYNGYPWTHDHSPQQGRSRGHSKGPSKTPSMSNMAMMALDKAGSSSATVTTTPIPGRPDQAYLAAGAGAGAGGVAGRPSPRRTPTARSLRSAINNWVQPRRREGAQEDDNNQLMRQSAGFDPEDYCDELLGYKTAAQRAVRGTGGAGPDSAASKRCSTVSSGDASTSLARWSGSKESLVMGVNDPASPTRLSPLSPLYSQRDSDATARSVSPLERDGEAGGLTPPPMRNLRTPFSDSSSQYSEPLLDEKVDMPSPLRMHQP